MKIAMYRVTFVVWFCFKKLYVFMYVLVYPYAVIHSTVHTQHWY